MKDEKKIQCSVILNDENLDKLEMFITRGVVGSFQSSETAVELCVVTKSRKTAQERYNMKKYENMDFREIEMKLRDYEDFVEQYKEQVEKLAEEMVEDMMIDVTDIEKYSLMELDEIRRQAFIDLDNRNKEDERYMKEKKERKEQADLEKMLNNGLSSLLEERAEWFKEIENVVYISGQYDNNRAHALMDISEFNDVTDITERTIRALISRFTEKSLKVKNTWGRQALEDLVIELSNILYYSFE